MVINLDTDVLVEHGLTASEFIFLFLLFKKETDLIWKVCDDIDTHGLEENGWMKKSGIDLKDWTARQKFVNLNIGKTDQMWYELCSRKPFKVPNGVGGNRILRAKDPDAITNTQARKLYSKLTKDNPELHKKVLRCLEFQLKEMRNNLQYLQNTETWIRRRTWEKYEHLLTEQEEEIQQVYGSKII